jgi:hypothetical protein
MNIKFKINRLRHFIFGEKFYKRLNFDWTSFPTRIQIIQKIINLKKFKSYLEIGCYNDNVFSNIIIDDKTGVDPVSGGNIRETSDNFFKKNNRKFDLIFIDGLHHYDQVKKDIENSIFFLNVNGIIVIHDCMPRSFIEQAVPQSKGTWTGDVWKNIVECRTLPFIQTYTVYVDHGISILLKRPNKNILDLKLSDFKKLKFEDFYYNHNLYFNVISFDDMIKFI